MEFEIAVNMEEMKAIGLDDACSGVASLTISVNGKEFDCVPVIASQKSDHTGCFVLAVSGHGFDKKAQEIAQAKAEVNRTKGAHKEAQRKLSALMEEKNVQ